jgi:perosamine synthetase
MHSVDNDLPSVSTYSIDESEFKMFDSISNGNLKDVSVIDMFAGNKYVLTYNTRVAIKRIVDLLKLKAGDEVIAPAYNCGSELDPFISSGINVRLYDLNIKLEVNINNILSKINVNTKAIYVTNYFGVVLPNIDELIEVIHAHGLPVIEDNALCMFGPSANRAPINGDISVFCFYKFFPVFGGGAIVVNSPEIPHPQPFQKKGPLLPAMIFNVKKQIKKIRVFRSLNTLNYSNRYESDISLNKTRPDIPKEYYFQSCLKDTKINSDTYRNLLSLDAVRYASEQRGRYKYVADRITDISGAVPLIDSLPSYSVPSVFPLLLSSERSQLISARMHRMGGKAYPWWSGYHRQLDFSGMVGACRLKDSVLALPIEKDMSNTEVDDNIRILEKCIGL